MASYSSEGSPDLVVLPAQTTASASSTWSYLRSLSPKRHSSKAFTKCISKKCILLFTVVVLLIVVLGVLAEFRSRWEDRRIEDRITPNVTTPVPEVSELPFWVP